jgi:hypothetical protein
MRSHREPLLSALAGLLVGIFATLLVVDFQATLMNEAPPDSMWERQGIFVILLVLAVAAIVAYLKLARSSAPESDAGVPEPEERRKDGPLPKAKEPEAREALDKDRRKEKELARGGKPAPGSGRAPALPPPRESRTPSPPPVQNSVRPMSNRPPEPPPPVATPAHSGRLVEAWGSYFDKGNGRFDANGLRQYLEPAGIKADILSGDQIEAGDNVLIVDLREGSGELHVLPNFTKPIRALEEWFRPLGSGDRTAFPQRLIRPATARRWDGRITFESKGEVE